MLKKVGMPKAKISPKAKSWLKDLEIEPLRVLKTKNLYDLDQQARSFDSFLESSGSRNVFKVDDLQGYPAVQNVFTVRNKRIHQAVVTSPYWKRVIKKMRTREMHHVDVDSREEFVMFEITEDLVKKVLTMMFREGYQYLKGHVFFIPLSKAGKVKDFEVTDT